MSMADPIVTIHVPLLNQVGEWRPVKAVHQREDIYCIVGPVAAGEEWQYPPGTMVRRKLKVMSNGKQEMVAAPL
jgi:hypothetical protein